MELEDKVRSLASDAVTSKAAADAELKMAHAIADAKIQTYNQRTNEVCSGISVGSMLSTIGSMLRTVAWLLANSSLKQSPEMEPGPLALRLIHQARNGRGHL